MRLSWVMLIYLISICFSIGVSAQASTAPININNLTELSEAIDKIRVRTNTPGIAVGLVQKGQPNWQHYSGLADLDNHTTMNENSQFRFGSISKMFVGLSILKLAEEGELNLNSKLTELAPEIEFSNSWEATHPIRIVHLLNHSAGWDNPHFIEGKPISSTPVSTIDALNIHPHSRVSRWQPRSRVAYNNTSFLAAAFIVEKITGMSYESYIKKTFFLPLNMNSSGYYFSDTYRESAVSLYTNNQKREYYHLNNRPSGGLNSSIRDMLAFITMLSQDGSPDIAGNELLKTFRTPQGTKASDEGLSFGWGLGNQLFHSNGVTLYGHSGSLRGTNSMLIYNPEHAFGYIIVANNNSPAVNEIHKLMSGYLTQNIEAPSVAPERAINDKDKQLSGWYKDVAPISKPFSIISTIVPWQLKVSDKQVSIKPLLGAPARLLIPDATDSFKQNTTGLTVLMPSVDVALGDVIYYGPKTYMKTNVVSALAPLLVIVLWVLVAISGVVFMIIWIPRYLFKKSIPTESIKFRLWPIISLTFAIFTLACVRIVTNAPNMYELAGTMSAHSIFIFAGTIAFFISALWSIWEWVKNRKLNINGFTKWHTGLFIFSHFLLAVLLINYGFIGFRLWV